MTFQDDENVVIVAAALESLVTAVEAAADDTRVTVNGVVRFAASKVALFVGLHEFGDVGEAVLEHVYQDREELLEEDAKALNLRIVSKDDELQELMNKTGAMLAPRLEEILSWTRGRQSVTQTDAAGLLQDVDTLVTEAHSKRKLEIEEALEVKRQLTERIRLSYGSRNEDLALKAYEHQTGSVVRQSNEELYVLAFPGLRTMPVSEVDFSAIEQSIERLIVVHDANRRQRRRKSEAQGDSSDDQVSAHTPYFTICGMIDGVADTLVIGDDDEWQLEPILLEVKNRMRGFRVPPPLHDYIQMAIYLKMVGLASGDLIQCLHGDRAQIHVTRVSLQEHPLYYSLGAVSDNLWTHVLLPRLYTMVSTIEKLRHNDLLRLAYLNGSEAERLEILRRECDFL